MADGILAIRPSLTGYLSRRTPANHWRLCSRRVAPLSQRLSEARFPRGQESGRFAIRGCGPDPATCPDMIRGRGLPQAGSRWSGPRTHQSGPAPRGRPGPGLVQHQRDCPTARPWSGPAVGTESGPARVPQRPVSPPPVRTGRTARWTKPPPRSQRADRSRPSPHSEPAGHEHAAQKKECPGSILGHSL